MKNKINFGVFRGDVYIKKVVFSKAVLWKDRQLSLRADVMNRIKLEGIKKIIFIDETKGEQWTFKPEKVFADMKKKTVGQEAQYYFSIDLARKKEIAPVDRPDFVFDEARQVYIKVMPKANDSKRYEMAGADTLQVSLF